MTDRLAAQVAEYSNWRTGTVTDVSRSRFQVDLGGADGIRRGLEAEVIRFGDSGKIIVARAKVIEAGDAFSRLRRTDRGRRLRIRRDDTVRIAIDTRFMMGGIGGVPRGIGDVLRARLMSAMRDDHGLVVLDGPDDKPAAPWPWESPAGLCRSATDRGCTHALAAWAEAGGDTIRLALGLIEAKSRKTVALYSGSADSDPAIAALIAEAGKLPPGAGDIKTTPHEAAGTQFGSFARYETGLAPSIWRTVPAPALAAHVLEGQKALCVIYERSLEIYKIHPAGERLVRIGAYEIEPPPRAVPCRDAVAMTAYMDSDGDDTKELVIWSSRLAAPAAFSVSHGAGDDPVSLERAETYWLPWADPLGDARYAGGRNYMMIPARLDDTRFYSWKTADLDADGVTEVIVTQVDATVTVRDTSMAVVSRLMGAGAPIEVFDMNGDGPKEIVLSLSSDPSEPDQMAIYSWSGDGFEQTWKAEDLPGGVVSMAAGHLDGDDLPDLVAIFRDGARARESNLIVLLTSKR